MANVINEENAKLDLCLIKATFDAAGNITTNAHYQGSVHQIFVTNASSLSMTIEDYSGADVSNAQITTISTDTVFGSSDIDRVCWGQLTFKRTAGSGTVWVWIWRYR